MRALVRFLLSAGALASAATPAAASVSLSIDGTLLQGADALRQAIGDATIPARFSAGLLLTIDASPPTTASTMSQRWAYSVNQYGVIDSARKWWGYANEEYVLTSESYSIAFDHDRADANDPTYPLWFQSAGNKLLILFDWGVVPRTLSFDLDADFGQQRNSTFRGVSVGTAQPYPDEENFIAFLPPSNVENGSIRCSSTTGREALTNKAKEGFQNETHASQVSTGCNISIDVSRFLAVEPPPSVDPVPAIPEPATWAMMISGFAMVGSSLRRGRVRQHVHA